jgi:hypothetical protein
VQRLAVLAEGQEDGVQTQAGKSIVCIAISSAVPAGATRVSKVV